jgi:hypothetical protein
VVAPCTIRAAIEAKNWINYGAFKGWELASSPNSGKLSLATAEENELSSTRSCLQALCIFTFSFLMMHAISVFWDYGEFSTFAAIQKLVNCHEKRAVDRQVLQLSMVAKQSNRSKCLQGILG